MRSRNLMLLAALTAALVNLSPASCAAQNETLDGHHSWVRFGIGSWKLVRVYSEELDENGQVDSVSVKETKTTLTAADQNGYTLNVDVTVEVAGRRFVAKPKVVTYGYNGELAGQEVKITDLENGSVEINGTNYPTVTQQVVINGETKKSVSRIQYNREAAPYFLKRATEVTDVESLALNYRSIVEVIALEMPEKVFTEIKAATYVRTLIDFANGESRVTLEVHCQDVPGGVISHTSKHLTENGRVKQRSTLELVDYGIKPMVSKSSEPVRRLLPKRRRRE